MHNQQVLVAFPQVGGKRGEGSPLMLQRHPSRCFAFINMSDSGPIYVLIVCAIRHLEFCAVKLIPGVGRPDLKWECGMWGGFNLSPTLSWPGLEGHAVFSIREPRLPLLVHVQLQNKVSNNLLRLFQFRKMVWGGEVVWGGRLKPLLMHSASDPCTPGKWVPRANLLFIYWKYSKLPFHST